MIGLGPVFASLLRARRFDEVLVEHGAHVTGVYHVSIGMEATSAALAAVRAPQDQIMLGHRNHAHLVAIGSDPRALYRELLGRDGGPQRGRAGSFHLADPGLGVPYTSAMLGGGAAVATGLALAKRRRGDGGIVFTCFGDGAMGEGIVYETLNLAAAWRLPLVLVCENNAPAGTEGGTTRVAQAHGVPGASVDGRDARATLSALSSCAERARSGGGPSFLEVGSEPWPGNSTFLPHLSGRLELGTVQEPPADAFEQGDPVRREASALLAEGVALRELVELDEALSAELRQAMEEAIAAPVAPGAVAVADVWGEA